MQYSSLLLLFILSSCGLRVSQEIDENILQGEWKLLNISCFHPNNRAVEAEKYLFNNEENIVFTFTGGEFSYSVADSTCTTSAFGSYNGNFNGTTSSSLTLSNINTSSSCSITVLDIMGAGNVSIPMALDASRASKLEWAVIDKELLELDFFSGFLGSEQAGFCDSECKCIASFNLN